MHQGVLNAGLTVYVFWCLIGPHVVSTLQRNSEFLQHSDTPALQLQCKILGVRAGHCNK